MGGQLTEYGLHEYSLSAVRQGKTVQFMRHQHFYYDLHMTFCIYVTNIFFFLKNIPRLVASYNYIILIY